MKKIVVFLLGFACLPVHAVDQRVVNNGNLILQDIPEIPASLSADLNRYQNVRSAGFRSWTADGRSIYITTRFGDVTQLHRVDLPGGARHQLTFHDEPLGGVTRRPGSEEIAFTMDAGGSEFSQIFLLDTRRGISTMLTDGESRHRAILWNQTGSALAYSGTQRNGRSNDLWVMDVNHPESAELAYAAPDGASYTPADFSSDGKRLLFRKYTSITHSEVYTVDLQTGQHKRLAGTDNEPTANTPVGFNQSSTGFFFLTDQNGEFIQLAWAPVAAPDKVRFITSNIRWNIEDVVLSDDRKRAAFVVNAGGIFELYLLDTGSFEYRRVENLPTGLIGGMAFSPDNSALAMTLNTPKTPSDTFVLSLGKSPTDYRELVRWTYSEVGGIDTETFIEPTLVEFQTFDNRQIPAFYYKPTGKGPHPVVISIHGGPESQALPAFSSTYQMWMAQLGVAVLVPNVRGSDGYGRPYLLLDNTYRREDSVRDIGALLDWIKDQPELDEERVAVYGGSYGGYMVLASAVHYSDRLKAAVDVVGISNFVTFLENTQDYRQDLRRVEYGDERDPDMRAHLEKISPLNNVDRIHIPMLVVQGNNDPRVPVSEAEQIVSALRLLNQPVWYMNALNEGHGYRKKENRDIYQQATVMFLRRFLVGEQ